MNWEKIKMQIELFFFAFSLSQLSFKQTQKFDMILILRKSFKKSLNKKSWLTL